MTIRPHAGSAEDLQRVDPIQSDIMVQMYQTTDSVYTPTLGDGHHAKHQGQDQSARHPHASSKDYLTERQRRSRSQRALTRREYEKLHRKQQTLLKTDHNEKLFGLESAGSGAFDHHFASNHHPQNINQPLNRADVRSSMAELSPGGYTTSNQASPLRRFSRPPSKLSKSSQQSVGNHEGLLHFTLNSRSHQPSQ